MAASHGDGSELVVAGEREEARIVDGLAALPPQDDGLLAVVLALGRTPLEAIEGLLVSVHQGVQIVA
jgi:hypothetical protein